MADNRWREVLLVGVLAGWGAWADAAEPKDHDHDEHKKAAKDHAHAEGDAPEARTAEAHVHGAWELFAALDGESLNVTIMGPLADLAGVEHAAGSPEETAALSALRAELADLDPIVSIGASAKCRLPSPAEIQRTSDSVHHVDDDDHDHDERDDGDHDEGHDDPDTDHAEDHDADHEGDHDGDHDVHEDHGEHGADVEITYAFVCSAPNRLNALRVDAFKAFDGVETIDAVFLGDAKQVAARLTPANATLVID
ncbi:MAG: DUF2796 domain-containing protein [Pseudomonadota bacterium]